MRGRAVQERRRAEAEERQAAREARTPAEQLRLIEQRPGQSLRETTRLKKKLGSKPSLVKLRRQARVLGIKDWRKMSNEELERTVLAGSKR